MGRDAALRPHLDSQIRPTPSGRPADSLVHKTLVILDPIQNTLDVPLVSSCGIRFFLPADSAEEPTRGCSIMNTYAAGAERRKLPKTRALVLALSVILAAAWQVACGGGSGRVDTALAAAPAASIAPGSLAFGNQTINTTSAAQTVTLTNTGNAALSIAGITVTGTNASDFAQTNTCGSSLAASANCTITVTFTPSASGSRTASVSISDNASGSPQTVSLSGTGTAPVDSLSPTSLAFGNQSVGTTSTAQTATLSNTGSTALSITSLALTGTNASDFAQTNTCGSSVAAGANCTISVTFTPAASGSRTASVSITDNASGSPQTVSLSGTGTAALASLSPTSLAFGNQSVGPVRAFCLSRVGEERLRLPSGPMSRR